METFRHPRTTNAEQLAPGRREFPKALSPRPRAFIVLRLDVRAVLQQQLHDGAVAFGCCPMQGGLASARR